jgi:hypothetical protein
MKTVANTSGEWLTYKNVLLNIVDHLNLENDADNGRP